MTDQMLKAAVMRRVYIVYWWRRVMGSPVLKLVAISVLVGLEVIFVSIVDVLKNAFAYDHTTDTLVYLFRAFTNTELLVQALFFGTLLAGGFAMRDWRGRQSSSLTIQ